MSNEALPPPSTPIRLGQGFPPSATQGGQGFPSNNNGQFPTGAIRTENLDDDFDQLIETSSTNDQGMGRKGELQSPPLFDPLTSPNSGIPASTPGSVSRRQKMEEMKRAQLEKMRNKNAIGSPTAVIKNIDQIKRDITASPTSMNSSTLANRPSSSSIGRQPNFGEDSDEEEMSSRPSSGAIRPSSGNLMRPNSGSVRPGSASVNSMTDAERNMIEAGVAPVYDPGVPSSPKSTSSLSSLNFSDMRSFLTSPVPQGITLECNIRRNKSGIMNALYPSYEMTINADSRFLLSARKRSKNKTSNYAIYMEPLSSVSEAKESSSYLGKLRSNFVGTEFVVYDRGINPKEVFSQFGNNIDQLLQNSDASVSLLSVRQELCAVLYDSNIIFSKGPRKMTAVVPSIRKDLLQSINSGAVAPTHTNSAASFPSSVGPFGRVQWKPLKEADSLLQRFKSDSSNPDFLELVNKPPVWNENMGTYVLNFRGRVSQASVKNFQLIDPKDPNSIVLQFGRNEKNLFALDIQYPLSPLQAFSIALSSFDYKIACE